ncbi:glycoside hydrolase family 3 protein [Moniliophthora roreri]|uniref:xylan 1,4-beta-xylosidase n=1 Tax=Moniliophthora roreri TaxID=221103 RepID=A0A0W0G760_MONRR|nr:glycoside hydrolase family 3 protein [Moniliophthora roreri]
MLRARIKTHLPLLIVNTLILASNGAFPDCTSGPLAENLVCDITAPSIERARALIAEFTVPELIQNMDTGSPGVPRLGLPAYNWWSEALHGVAISPGTSFAPPGQDFSYATSFPAPITMGAAFDDELIQKVAIVISTESRAFNNVNRAGLSFFTPNINPFKDPRWGRGQETPGEDPFHISQYVYQLVTGLQGGVGPTKLKIAADCKHWAAYDLENLGASRFEFDAKVTLQDLAEFYSPPFQSCIRDAKVASIMCSYNAVNGIPSCANRYILQDLARDLWELGEEQWIVGDCGAVGNISARHHYTDDPANGTAVALNAGTDIDCARGPAAYSQNLGQALNRSLVSEDQLRTALTRQYNSLVRLGYFDPADQQPYRSLSWDDVNTEPAQQLAYQAAVEGVVLLKNDGVLPLASSVTKVAVVGPMANATRQMQSNYNGPAPFLISPQQAFHDAGFDVAFANGTSVNSSDSSGFNAAIATADDADVIFFVGGIDVTIEAEGHDRPDISWPGNQLALVQQLAALGKPLVVLQMGGGQVDSSSLRDNDNVNALIWGGYPGQSGGTALIDIITGKQAPAGRLPITQYPASYVNGFPMTDMTLRPSSSNPGRTYKWYTGTPVFEFGFGLHYTTFDVEWASGGDSFSIQDLVSSANDSGVAHVDLGVLDTFNVTVTNSGTVASDYVALLFSRTTAGPSPAPNKELVSYTRVKGIEPGASSVASLKVTLGAIARTDEQGNRVLYPGEYVLLLDTGAEGKIQKNITLTGDEATLIEWPQP